MKLVHISDTHGAKFHSQLIIPECDVLIHSGDIGGRTTLLELEEFLRWYSRQKATVKIWVPGNHDLCMDKVWANQQGDSITMQIRHQIYADAMALLDSYPDIKCLINKDYVYSGFKFYGSPITPSFHRTHWAFNADRGEEISKYWARIPSDTHILITHGPGYGTLDTIPEKFKTSDTEDIHRGCEDLKKVIKDRLHNLELHCFGHLHNSYGVILEPVSNTRNVLFSNGSVLNEQYGLVIREPLIINI
jgi:Icc-related predicted phosphoesterase